MDGLEELVCRPEVSLALGQLWTRLQRQAVEEDKNAADIAEEMIADNPQQARMFMLLGIWLQQQD
jgi:hypothetical protein